MSLLGVFLTLTAITMVFFLERRFAALGVLGAVCYITQGQQIEVAGLNVTAIRLVLLAGVIRLITRNELREFQWGRIDKAVVIYAAVVFCASMIRTGGSTAVLVFQLGCTYDILVSYFVFRGLLSNLDDLISFLPRAAILILPLALCMLVEAATGINVFRQMGGLSYESTIMREGRFRCQGSFRGPITAGVFGATVLPLFIGLWVSGIKRHLAVIGAISALAIALVSNSSGPLMALLSAFAAMLFWSFRHNLKRVRYGILALLILLHLVMKPPVWYLVAKISALTGGDGWHRSYLIDQAVHFLPEWWLVGTDDTAAWMPVTMTLADGREAADITNQYVSAGVNGGVLGVLFFIGILVACFRQLGRALGYMRAIGSDLEKLLWCLGAALFAHLVTIISVTYFDQMHVPWWGLLAIISSVTSGIPTVWTQVNSQEAVERSHEGFPINPRQQAS